MELGEVALGIYVTILSSGLATLLWARLNRIEDKLERKADKEEVNAVRTDVAALRTELGVVRTDIRADLAGLRSDLTQVALAVGAYRERAAE